MEPLSNKPSGLPHTELTPWLRGLMTFGCAVVVANIYYCQPLLGTLARSFSVSQQQASLVNILTQVGYGLGLFFLVPLGDMVPRKRLIIGLHGLAALSLMAAARAPSLLYLGVFSVLIGMASTACQVFLPFAAHLAGDRERGRVIGSLLGGLLVGILVSRTLSGLVADLFGWRTVFGFASLLMLGMGIILALYLPGEIPAFRGSYRQLMGSLWDLFRQQPIVRQSALIGASLFGAVSAFWATMAFLLEGPPYHYRLSLIGLFGLIGAGGALAAPLIGRLSDRKDPLIPIRFGIGLLLSGYLILFWGTSHLGFVLAGVVLLDIGMQAAHVPNMTRNYALLPEARTRINTLYMTSFFIGGTLGSTLGSLAWNEGGWTGVCVSGLFLGSFSLIPLLRKSIKRMHDG